VIPFVGVKGEYLWVIPIGLYHNYFKSETWGLFRASDVERWGLNHYYYDCDFLVFTLTCSSIGIISDLYK